MKQTGIMSDTSFHIKVARDNLKSSTLKDGNNKTITDGNGNSIKTWTYDDKGLN